MNEIDNYQKCIQLSRAGDWESLNELLAIYLSAPSSQEKKDARKALRKARNRKAVIAIIHNAIDAATTDELRLDLLFTGQLIYRARFIYDYLTEVVHLKGKVQKQIIDDMLAVSPLSDEEMDEIVRFIIEKNYYSAPLFYVLDDSHQGRITDHILSEINKGVISYQALTLIKDNEKALLSIQRALRCYLLSSPENSDRLLPFIKMDSHTEEILFDAKMGLFATYKALKQYKWDLSSIVSSNINIQISVAVINQNKLSDLQWQYIRDQINNEISASIDIDYLDMSFYAFLKGLSKIDREFTEKIYITLYERTGLYSNRILYEMTELSIPYAYRILTSRLLSVQNDIIRRKTIVKLLKYFGDKAGEIYEYVLQMESEQLIDFTKEIAQKYNCSLKPQNPAEWEFSIGQQAKIINHSVVVSELLARLAKKINANIFLTAVGFAYTSGLKMLKPVLDEVKNNGGQIDMIVGSLQSYGTGGRNTRIDRSTAMYLNMLIEKYKIRLFTYHNTFYHGKYYYLANDDSAYIIMGSSNISRTAYLSNYELDSVMMVERGSEQDTQFIDWFRGFRFECDAIDFLNEEDFEEFFWNSEQQMFTGKKTVQLSETEVKRRIGGLTDIDTKRRLNMWINHNPSEILSELGIPALEGYIAFLFSDLGLAVFESFVPGNAFYSFRYYDFDKLILRLARITKTEMVLTSEFLLRGYHIQDHEKLERKIEKLLSIHEAD